MTRYLWALPLLLVTLARPAGAVCAPVDVTIEGKAGAVLQFRLRTVPVVLRVSATARTLGTDTPRGEGEYAGLAFDREFIERSRFRFTRCATSGRVVTLVGTIFDSIPALVGATIVIVADGDSGAIEITLSSISSGWFAGQTLHFVGAGRVAVLRRRA